MCARASARLCCSSRRPLRLWRGERYVLGADRPVATRYGFLSEVVILEQQQATHATEVVPNVLAAEVINHYLDVKARHLL